MLILFWKLVWKHDQMQVVVCVVPVPKIRWATGHTAGCYTTGCCWAEGLRRIDAPLDRWRCAAAPPLHTPLSTDQTHGMKREESLSVRFPRSIFFNQEVIQGRELSAGVVEHDHNITKNMTGVIFCCFNFFLDLTLKIMQHWVIYCQFAQKKF